MTSTATRTRKHHRRHGEPPLPDDLWSTLPRALFCGDNQVELLSGGDQLFPAMARAIDAARHEVWLATYIYQHEGSVTAVTDALLAAAARGVAVRVVLDGFGSRAFLPQLQPLLENGGVDLAVFRPITSWWSWFQPGQLRRLHQKLCVVDGEVGFVGGINQIDDRIDLVHGVTEQPRLDFAVQLRGPVVAPVEQAIRAVWTRADLGQDFREEMVALARSAEPIARAKRLMRRLRMPRSKGLQLSPDALPPVRAAFVLRDNLRQRRTIERSYIDAIRGARERVDLISPYFYPGRPFRRALRDAADRGVAVRLLLQGKLDYRIAGLAARVLYDELLAHGVRIHEYTPAYLHAKVAVIDGDWATVGSSNIDPLSLLLNLEANVIVRDEAFTRSLAERFDAAAAQSREIDPKLAHPRTLAGTLRRGFVAWCAHVYLRIAGQTGRY
ncbi:cardiolipin synthase ClsB [Rhizobacter sp. P5_C2]